MKHYVIWFLLGSGCFLVAQPLTRIPLLSAIQQTTEYHIVLAVQPLLVGIMIAFSAGLFEEGFRFLFKLLILKPPASRFSQPILFGLGHGLTEAVLVLAPAMKVVSIDQLAVGILERILAVWLHVALTVIVWNGFQKGKRVFYLISALVVHGLVNTLIPVFSSHPQAIVLIEGSLFLIDLLLIVVVVYSKRLYVTREGLS